MIEWYLPLSALSNITLPLAMGLFVLFKNRRSKTNQMFFLFTVSVSVWAFGYFHWVTSTDQQSAIFWVRILTVGSIWITFLYYWFVINLLNLKQKKYKIILIAGIVAGCIFTVLDLTTSLLISSSRQILMFPFWPIPGPLYLPKLAMFMFYALYALLLLWNEYRRGSRFRKNQIKYILLGYLIGVLGGSTNYPQWYGMEVLPVGNALVSLYPILAGYAIVKYHLMEIDTVIHRTFMWATTVLLLILPVCFGISLTMDWFGKITPLLRVSVLAIILLFFLGYYHKLKPKIDHLFRRRKYDYHQELIDIPSRIGTELELHVLVERLFGQLKEVLYIQNALLVVKFPEKEDYEEAGNMGYETLSQKGIFKEKEEETLPLDSTLIQWLTHHPKALEREQVEIDPQYRDIKDETLRFFQSNALEVMIPLLFEENLTGLLGLGKKENLQHYLMKDLELLERLGTQISITIDNALHHKDIVEKQRLQEELRLGQELQMSLIPTETPRIPGFRVFGMMNAAREIGGDYYDFIPHKDTEALSVAIGDVSGKGLDAGIVMAMTKTIIFSLALQTTFSPKEILTRTNEVLYFHVNLKKFVTMLYLHLEPNQNQIKYSSAGHERILIKRTTSQEIEVIKSGGLILGMLGDNPHLQDNSLTLNPGDKILLYTDGATEARNLEEKMFGLKHLLGSFQKHADLPIKYMLDNIYGDIKSFMSTREQYDDITLVGIEKE